MMSLYQTTPGSHVHVFLGSVKQSSKTLLTLLCNMTRPFFLVLSHGRNEITKPAMNAPWRSKPVASDSACADACDINIGSLPLNYVLGATHWCVMSFPSRLKKCINATLEDVIRKWGGGDCETDQQEL
jgi:hypothetical protein